MFNTRFLLFFYKKNMRRKKKVKRMPLHENVRTFITVDEKVLARQKSRCKSIAISRHSEDLDSQSIPK